MGLSCLYGFIMFMMFISVGVTGITTRHAFFQVQITSRTCFRASCRVRRPSMDSPQLIPIVAPVISVGKDMGNIWLIYGIIYG
jgi:hypothetical protein